MSTFEARFWNKVNKTETCWLWTAACFKNGYGAFLIRAGVTKRAHRVVWELLHGPIPKDLRVLHTCDVRECVNPSHLYLGTDKDNARDREERQRRYQPLGNDHHNSILTEAAVIDIREGVSRGLTQRHFSSKYGVSCGAISNVVRRRTWTHL